MENVKSCSLAELENMEQETYQLLDIRSMEAFDHAPPERRKLGEKAKASGAGGIQTQTVTVSAHNEAEAAKVIPLIRQLLGIETK